MSLEELLSGAAVAGTAAYMLGLDHALAITAHAILAFVLGHAHGRWCALRCKPSDHEPTKELSAFERRVRAARRPTKSDHYDGGPRWLLD